MTLSASVGESLPAHGLHYAMVLLGLWGLGALLLPHALDRHAGGSARVQDAHDRRVAELRAALAGEGTPRRTTTLVSPPTAPAVESSVPAWGPPLALVATMASAGIHAAVAPPHLRESLLVGGFFLVVAALQVGWAAALLAHPDRAVLRLGLAANVGLVALWGVTRTAGLPWGLLPERHPVGGWDLVCVAWELVATWSCLRLLRHGAPARFPGWFEWHPTSRAAVGAAASALVLLTVLGAHS